MRLQKFLASCGIASRRKSEIIILEGRVKVNRTVIYDRAFKVTEKDIVELDGKVIVPDNKVYIVLNKPPGIICSHEDRWNRKTIYDIVKLNDKKLFSLGRLDYNSSGLIILTNDGEFANNIIHPSNNILKEYFVSSETDVPLKLARDFLHGVIIEGVRYKASGFTITDNKKNAIIKLKEGKKREIRVVYNNYSVKIINLRRIGIGNMKLKKLSLKEGEFKYFKLDELKNLILNRKS